MAYGDLTGFREYASARGNAAPSSASDVDASAALQRANGYIAYFYVGHFVTTPGNDTVVAAVYEAAQVELGKPGFFNKTYTPGEAKVLTEVKGIRWTVVGNAGADGAMTPTSTIIEAMLGKYVARGQGLGLRSVG